MTRSKGKWLRSLPGTTLASGRSPVLTAPLERSIRRFSDAFGERLRPTVLIVRTDAPPEFFDVEALAGFRDLIAIAAVTAGRAANLQHSFSHGILFGNTFAFYPWMIDRECARLIANSPAFLGGSTTSSRFEVSLHQS